MAEGISGFSTPPRANQVNLDIFRILVVTTETISARGHDSTISVAPPPCPQSVYPQGSSAVRQWTNPVFWGWRGRAAASARPSLVPIASVGLFAPINLAPPPPRALSSSPALAPARSAPDLLLARPRRFSLLVYETRDLSPIVIFSGLHCTDDMQTGTAGSLGSTPA